jgi:PWWP domain
VKEDDEYIDDDDEDDNDGCNVDVPKKSDFDILKESPPVNTIKPIVVDMMIQPESSPSNPSPTIDEITNVNFKIGDLIFGKARGCDAWPGKVVNGPENEPTSSNCVWVKWFGGRQNTEMVLCNTLKSLTEGLEAHHAARKETRK